MSSLALIRSQVENRVPGALRPYQALERGVFQTGIAAVDRLGIPRGSLTQICGAPERSSGRTTLLLPLMSELTRGGEFCALVDAGDCLDPGSVEAAGLALDRVLWVRCRHKDHKKKSPLPLEQAFKATDILVQNGGFALIAVDLASIPEKELRRVPLTTWFRFSRVVEKTDTALLFLSSYPAARSCAGLTLHLEGLEKCWPESARPVQVSHAKFLESADFKLHVGYSRCKKPVQSVPSAFTSAPIWK
jgi:RecA DNA recombination protein